MGYMRHVYNPTKHKLFVPKNLEKYDGNVPIVLRSGLELKFALWCDNEIKIVKWSSETIAIPYWNPIKKRYANYYPDFFITTDVNNKKLNYIIEIKPVKETPKGVINTINRSRSKNVLLLEKRKYMINSAKWNAALLFCNKYNMEFKIITEESLK